MGFQHFEKVSLIDLNQARHERGPDCVDGENAGNVANEDDRSGKKKQEDFFFYGARLPCEKAQIAAKRFLCQRKIEGRLKKRAFKPMEQEENPTGPFMNVQTTLNFYGRTEEAVKFYCRTIEAETRFMMRFRDCPDPSQSRPGMEEKIFHATFRIGSTEIMASDCGCERPPAETKFANFSLALRVETPEKAERFFAALSDGGQIQIPLVKTFFAERYGIVVDRFGISWKIMVESKTQN